MEKKSKKCIKMRFAIIYFLFRLLIKRLFFYSFILIFKYFSTFAILSYSNLISHHQYNWMPMDFKNIIWIYRPSWLWTTTTIKDYIANTWVSPKMDYIDLNQNIPSSPQPTINILINPDYQIKGVIPSIIINLIQVPTAISAIYNPMGSPLNACILIYIQILKNRKRKVNISYLKSKPSEILCWISGIKWKIEGKK